ncbi:TM2 domain-containing protein [Schleiferilactobacillus shenzhenensis]|uniref:TM2 domain-containing protein n=1 Tax=Schleiferilactobacillus shenzhenensis LY-73 TaxID=1231336 RepID=U4TVL5_9LACO|nr:TM2 domain-containing protein [Schleiferilactobacillus shenzhenensis]ERL65437.1 hypothetical protein L248_2836 [Schleiferilactobacillus shenzhenensis LY-73]
MENDYLLRQLTNEERMLVNSEVIKNQKSAAAAYLLWFFAGIIGAHRYYLGKTASAIAMTLTVVLTFGIGTIVTVIWMLVDVFAIGGWLEDDRLRLEKQAALEILARRSPPDAHAWAKPAAPQPVPRQPVTPKPVELHPELKGQDNPTQDHDDSWDDF